MRHGVLLLSCILSIWGFAEEPNQSKDIDSSLKVVFENGKIIAAGSTAEETLKICQDFFKLAKKNSATTFQYGVHSQGNQLENPCPELLPIQKGDSWQVDISKAVPHYMLEVIDRCPIAHGANCFNAALVSSGILPFFRESDAKEITKWIHSPLCRMLSATEEPKPGDIVILYNKVEEKKEIYHAMTYISEGVAFTKNSMNNSSSWRFVDPNAHLEKYGVPAENRNEDWTISHPDRSEKGYSTSFRCKSLAEYVEEKKVSSEVGHCYAQIEPLERFISQLNVYGYGKWNGKTYDFRTDDKPKLAETYRAASTKANREEVFNEEKRNLFILDLISKAPESCRRPIQDYIALRQVLEPFEMQSMSGDYNISGDAFLNEQFSTPPFVENQGERFADPTSSSHQNNVFGGASGLSPYQISSPRAE